MTDTHKIFPGVTLGDGSIVEDYAIIGSPPRGKKAGELQTTIGKGAIIRSHTVIYAGNRIGDNFQTGNKVNIRESNEIGDNVSIGTLSVIEHHVRIGNGVRMHSQVFVPEFTVIEDDAWLGPNVVITNAKYPLSPGVKETLAGPLIKKGAKIGANCHDSARDRDRGELPGRRRFGGDEGCPGQRRRRRESGTSDQDDHRTSILRGLSWIFRSST